MTKVDEGTRRAWATYRDSLRELEGAAYDEAERRSWERLQRDLHQLEQTDEGAVQSRSREGHRA